ncbi:uncharacterized protein LOC110465742 isoform X2 [Mizuhopecten yessoensis]|uniref:uncharacterized protein LOC110465742 isoform X2 n=1 Tax=Mizuhopecten yessoensis TaxID=6573 RepID=UPI000B45A98C|nr:uncharacterized protein LOC110465742 isoform X2 [Mizuhopecten yessoensis]
MSVWKLKQEIAALGSRVKYNNHLLEEDFPCEVLFDIQEAGVTLDETVSARLTEFQPLAITKQRSEVINSWLEKYQEALRDINVVCQNKNKISEIVSSLIKQHVTEDDLMNCLNFGKDVFSMKQQNGKTVENCVDEIIRKFSQIIGEKLSQKMNELICDKVDKVVICKQMIFRMEDKYGREFCDRIIKMIKVKKYFKNTNWGDSREDIASTLPSILKAIDADIKAMLTESMHNLHMYIKSVLEEEIIIVQEEKLLIPDVVENHQRRKLTSVCCGSMDSTRCSIGFRAESFDKIHVTIHRDIDAALDRKTVETATWETRYVDEYIHDNCLKMKTEEKRRLYKLVNKYSEDLMKKHSNLYRIGISPVLSRKSGIVEMPCIVMYCSCKGIIPQDEQTFRRKIENTFVDVREGYFSLFSTQGAREYNDPLRIGISIGGKGIPDAGTLGPFVVEAENKSSMGFLTCQHVLHSPKVGSQVVQPSLLHDKADNTTCGKIISTCLEDIQYKEKLTSIDVAYVVINQRIPKELITPERLINDFGGILSMGEPIMQMEEDTMVYKLGFASGLTAGCLETMMDVVKWGVMKKEERHNLYLILSDTEFATHGDSGSAVFAVRDMAIRVIGVLLGGSDNKKECYVMPIGAVLQALQAVGPRLEIHQFNYETGSGVHDSGGDPPGDNASSSLSGVGAEAGCAGGDDCPVLSRTVAEFASSK